jgi:hypothetical protein
MMTFREWTNAGQPGRDLGAVAVHHITGETLRLNGVPVMVRPAENADVAYWRYRQAQDEAARRTAAYASLPTAAEAAAYNRRMAAIRGPLHRPTFGNAITA